MEFRLGPHNEGGDYPKRHADPDDPFRWDFAAISSLKHRGCVAMKSMKWAQREHDAPTSRFAAVAVELSKQIAGPARSLR